MDIQPKRAGVVPLIGSRILPSINRVGVLAHQDGLAGEYWIGPQRRHIVFAAEHRACRAPAAQRHHVGLTGGILLRYYYREHLKGYERVKAEGKSAWGEIHGQEGFDNFSSREFLEDVLPRLTFSVPAPQALEYGCGTGPGACFLVERGFRVDAIDLVPRAIEMAKEIAVQRGLSIHFEVADVCDLREEGKRYDLIVDSYCLQCIVFDDERRRVFSAVRSRLKPGGYYLVSTAILDEEHEEMLGTDTVEDSNTGVTYTRYGSGLIDLDTGIVLQSLHEAPHEYPDATCIDGRRYLPHRRHLRPAALERELAAAGFRVIFKDEKYAGSLACGVGD